MAAKKAKSTKKKPAPEEFRSDALALALEKQDVAAVALALRNGITVVPLLTLGTPDNPLDAGEVWTYRDPNSGDLALLLFSDAKNKPENLPPQVGIFSAAWLRKFLGTHPITTVFLDIAGPHPMQASPQEILKALEA